MKNVLTLMLILVLCIASFNCTTQQSDDELALGLELAGLFLDGSLGAAKTVTVYEEAGNSGVMVKHMQSKDGNDFLTISFGMMPHIIFKSSMPDVTGRIYLTSYTFLCSSFSGWNEFTMDISGIGTFENKGDHHLLQIQSPIETIEISSGKIRHNDERISGDAAMRALRNRYDRIAALVAWMQTQSPRPRFYYEEDFQSFWQVRILPELVSSKNRPASWSANDELWNRAEDVKWNVSYTQKIFPEELHVYRNSGGLLRDWEEALSWIFLAYKWNDLCNQLNSTILFAKKPQLKKA
jgi:hypothetical protein